MKGTPPRPHATRRPWPGARILVPGLLLLVSAGTVLSLWLNVRELERKQRLENVLLTRSLAATAEAFLRDHQYQEFASLLELLAQLQSVTYAVVLVRDTVAFQSGDPSAVPSAALASMRYANRESLYLPRRQQLVVGERLRPRAGRQLILNVVFSLREFQRSKNNILVFGALIFLLLVAVVLLLVRLVRLERNKEELIRRITHDAKQDLTIIQGRLSLMLRRVKRGEIAAGTLRDLKIIRESAGSIDRFLTNLNDQQRLARGEIEAQPSPLSLLPLLRTLTAGIEERLAKRGLRLELDAPPDDDPVIVGDEHIVKRVVMNVLHNAVKHSPPHGRIRIGVERGTEAVVVTVADEGEGIPPQSWRRIFEPYTRLASRHQGTGLGLAISRELMALMGGRLGIRSSASGRGTTFYLAFPLPPATPPEGKHGPHLDPGG